MKLTLNKIIPDPLKERLANQYSDVWNNTIHFENAKKIFFQAPSGRGKSTFINILYGLRKDYSGTVHWDNKEVTKANKNTLAEWRSNEISIVFQDLRLFDELTVAENLLLKNNLLNNVDTQRMKDWVAYLGLESKWNQQAATLSYGEKQRIAIIRSLLQPFQWLLMDEPFSHLDNDNIQKCIHIISERMKQLNAGIILVDLEDNDWFVYDQKLKL